MDELDYKDIEYYGRPINSLNEEGLLKAFAEFATILWECAVQGKKCEDLFCIKKDIECYIKIREL